MPHLHHGAAGSSGAALLTLIVVISALVYLRGWLQLRSTLKMLSGWRAASFLFGLLMIWIAMASPAASFDHELLTVHMVQHLLLMTLAPPLIWLGAPVMAFLRGLPQPLVHSPIGRLIRRPLWQRLGKALAQPAFCWLAATVVLVGWHLPAAFALGMQSEAWHLVEHTSFLVTGLLFWWPVVQPWPAVSRWPDLSMVLYLFFATLPCDILSGFLVFCDRVVYPAYLSSPRLFGFSALEDQQCAGALMWTCVTIVYFVAGAILTTRLLSPRNSPEDLAPAEFCGAAGQRIPHGLEAR